MLKNYFKVAFRNLVRHKIFSLINILGLAVGMTACFLIYQYVRFETSYDSWHSKADRIYRVGVDMKTASRNVHGALAAAPVALNMKHDFPEVEDAVRIMNDDVLVRKGGVKFQEAGLLVDSSLFNIFDFPLLKGDRRTALKEPMSIILSETAAKKYFGSADPLGQHVLLTEEGKEATITGVMKDIPENSQIRTDMLLSLSSWEKFYGFPKQDTMWRWHRYYTYVLLRPHTNAANLAVKLPAFIETHHGDEQRKLQMFETLSLEPLRDVYLKSDREGMVTGNIHNVYIFSIIAIFILGIACINFVNLTTARSTVRAKEVGIRKVAGAARHQLAGQFLGESIIICWMAFTLTLLVGSIAMPWFNELAGKEISPHFLSRPIDTIILFSLSTLIGIIAGIYPSLILSSFKAINVLKGRFATSTQGFLLRKSLVIAQFTISITLIIGTLIVFRQLRYMRSQDLGFDKEQQVVIKSYMAADAPFRQSLASIPSVLSTAYSSGLPGKDHFTMYATLENKTGEMQKTILNSFYVDLDFAHQYDLKMVAGRTFSKDMSLDSSGILINETMVRLLGYAAPAEAVGRRYAIRDDIGRITGVFRDFNYTSLKEPIQPLAIGLAGRQAGYLSIKVSAHNLPGTLKAIGDNWRRLLPDKPFEYSFLDEDFSSQYEGEEKFGGLFLNFSVLAIFISCLGVLGLASYSTFQRTKEIGVRKILGASVTSIVRLLSVEFIKLVAIAFLIATPIGWYAMHKWLGNFAYQASLSWYIFGLSGLLALVVVIATISYQAIRAAVANPVKSLRTE